MQLFYFDEKIADFEKRGIYEDLLKYLENNIPIEKSLATLIAYSWYFYSEGHFINKEVDDNWEFYRDKWLYYINLAEKYLDNPSVCFIAGYTLNIKGSDVSDSLDYEKKINMFYDFCEKYSKNNSLSKLVNFIASNRQIAFDEAYINELFADDTLINRYFKDVFVL